MPKDSTQEFLDRIAQIESSNNYDAVHPTMNTGMHKDMHAVGRYGLMPLTIAELLQRKQAEIPTPEAPGEHEVGGLYRFINPTASSKSQEYRDNASIAADQLSYEPEAQDNIARGLAKKLLEKTGGDQDKAAYLWTNGHNSPVEKLTPEKLNSSDYVKKFRNLVSQDSEVPQLEEDSIRKKALGLLSKN